MALLAGIELYLFTSLGIWTKGKNVCKGTNKNLSETPVLNQACKTLVRTTATKKKTAQTIWYTESKTLYRKTF